MDELWNRRDETGQAHNWLVDIRTELIDPLLVTCRTLSDEAEISSNFLARIDGSGDHAEMTLSQFSGEGISSDRINLSSLHSAKGREFSVVILFATDQG
ncbi:hypothetical protein QCM77_41795 [Bradyrhizobium sp. SSUT18]|uniref:hypothetical protein n=1 Tax=Bradyrhizobium sp. SSUT18 TaxID=3040602 RepID=UPI002448BF28|nr:hypothetical protein [Bradyrhizobium sp. SSUT18]MDH2406362.1 hypothetical protein [Bradyrhizobium sp. SSUT18]